MLYLGELNKKELIKELRRVVKEDEKIRAKQKRKENEVKQLKAKIISIEKKHRGIWKRKKQIKIATVSAYIVSSIVFMLSITLLFKGFYKFLTFQWGDGIKYSPIFFIAWILICCTKEIFYFVKFIPKNILWPRYEKKAEELILKDEEHFELSKKVGSLEWNIPFIRYEFIKSREKNNLKVRYYGWESFLLDYLLSKQASTIKEATQLLEKEWALKKNKKRMTYDMRRANEFNAYLKNLLVSMKQSAKGTCFVTNKKIDNIVVF